MKLKIKDETFSKKIINEVDIDLETEIITIEDIIKLRIKKEIENNDLKSRLIDPEDIEKILNNTKKIDYNKQVEIALKAFGDNSYFILIDSIQAESLDQVVVINKDTKISFMKLTPLIGG